MGTVIRFPEGGRAKRDKGAIRAGDDGATIVILPVIRIERYEDMPSIMRPAPARRTRLRRRRRNA